MKKILGLSMVLALALGSCKKNILDVTPMDRVGETTVWKDEAFIKAYHTEMYNSIIHNFGVHMYSKLTDEAYNAVPSGQGPELYKLNTLCSRRTYPEVITRIITSSTFGTGDIAICVRSIFSLRKWMTLIPFQLQEKQD